MKINELLVEAKTGIAHPEDVILDQDINAVIKTIQVLINTGHTNKDLSVKFDGSPVIMFGYDHKGFTLVDKSRFTIKNEENFPRSASQLEQLIFSKNPDQPGRDIYASQLSKLFPALQASLPKNFQGFLQADVLWLSKPDLIKDSFVFTPNKVKYQINAQSSIGQRIAASSMGIVVHSKFQSVHNYNPINVPDISVLGLTPPSSLVILDTQMPAIETQADIAATAAPILKFIKDHQIELTDLLNKQTLAANKISNFPALIKTWLAQQSRLGTVNLNSAPHKFLAWTKTAKEVSENKRLVIQQYVADNQSAYKALWQVINGVIKIKNHVLVHLNSQTDNYIRADISGNTGHEGFVSNSKLGRVKFVDRPKFMKKDGN